MTRIWKVSKHAQVLSVRASTQLTYEKSPSYLGALSITLLVSSISLRAKPRHPKVCTKTRSIMFYRRVQAPYKFLRLCTRCCLRSNSSPFYETQRLVPIRHSNTTAVSSGGGKVRWSRVQEPVIKVAYTGSIFISNRPSAVKKR